MRFVCLSRKGYVVHCNTPFPSLDDPTSLHLLRLNGLQSRNNVSVHFLRCRVLQGCHYLFLGEER